MFGHSAIGETACGEFPLLRTVFALVARFSVVPALRATRRIVASVSGSSRIRPR